MCALLLLPLLLFAQSDETSRLLQIGTRLSASNVEKMEEALKSKPDDLKRHITLLGYYEAAERIGGMQSGAEEARVNHLEWLVSHRSASDALRSEAALPHAVESTSPAYKRIRDLWLAELKRNPKSMDVHVNAVHFLALSDRQTARAILQDAAQLDPKNRGIPFLMGVLDGLTVIDVGAIGHDGLPDANTIPRQPSEGAVAALKSLEESDDARRVCGAGVAVVRYGSVLLGTPSPGRDVLRIAASLLNRALSLDGRTTECIEYGSRVNSWQAIGKSGWLENRQGRRVVVDGALAQRWKASDVPPVYPPQAKTRGVHGTVTLIGVIGDDGRVQKAEAVNGPDALRPAALESFQHWKYSPPRITGKPVEYLTDVQFHFTLSR